MKFWIANVCLVSPFLASGLAWAAEFPIVIEGCPSALSLSVPADFSVAVTPAQIARRTAILDGLHKNPGRTARYSEVLLTDWESESTHSTILVASLGSTRALQGQVTQMQWESLKKFGLASSESQREEWLSQGLARLTPGMSGDIEELRVEVSRISDGGPNEFTTLAATTATVAGQPLHQFSAAKMIYAKHCLAYVIISVNADDEGAMHELLRYTEEITVR